MAAGGTQAMWLQMEQREVAIKEQKKKSAKEWKARLSTTAKSQADKQKSRTENLAARGTKGKSKANKRKEIVKKRAGFEGAAKPLN